MDNFSSQRQAIMCVKRCSQVFNSESNQKYLVPKMLMSIHIRDLHNNMIKSPGNYGFDSVFYSVTNIFMISDTTLRLFIPS